MWLDNQKRFMNISLKEKKLVFIYLNHCESQICAKVNMCVFPQIRELYKFNCFCRIKWIKCVPFWSTCPGFLKGGGPISLGSLKKGHQILKGGQWSDGGGGSSTLVSLGRQILHMHRC